MLEWEFYLNYNWGFSMTIITDFQNGVNEALSFGQQIRIRYFNVGFGAGSYYDDDVQLTISGGDYWTSGVILPITSPQGRSEAVLVEQGQLLTNDTKLYVEGSLNTSGALRIGIGSNGTGSPVPITGEYEILSQGVTKWDVNATPILKKLYIRKLLTGSLTGEV